MRAIVLLGLVLSSPAFAGQPLFSTLACPAIGEEYGKMIAKLDAIKASVKRDANCDQVALKVKSLEDLVGKDRDAVLDIFDKAQGQALTPEQSKTVRDYAENVTKKVAALNDLFSQANFCFKDDKADQQLTSLAGFVGEAANMVGSLSGPYGAPIALAGNVVAGFLTGLDQVLKTRAGYDFSKRPEWVSYVQNLCTYHSYREQIEHLLDPRGRIQKLQTLKAKLDAQIDTMARDCAECRAIVNEYQSRSGASEPELANLLASQIRSADTQFAKPYGSYMLQSLGLRDWATTEITRVQRESSSYWADASGRYQLTQAKADIEQFLIEREAPKFVAFGTRRARADFGAFTSMVNGEGRTLYYTLTRANAEMLAGRMDNRSWYDPVSIFRALVIQPLDWGKIAEGTAREEAQYAWARFHDQSLNLFRTALASTQVVQSFCSFFKHAGLYSPSLRNTCGLPDFNEQVAQQTKLTAELDRAGVSLGPLNGGELPGDGTSDPIEAILRAIDSRGVGR